MVLGFPLVLPAYAMKSTQFSLTQRPPISGKLSCPTNRHSQMSASGFTNPNVLSQQSPVLWSKSIAPRQLHSTPYSFTGESLQTVVKI